MILSQRTLRARCFLMKATGQDSYRMSIAWSRMIPDGTGEVNPLAVSFYNRVINKLLECGIKPLIDIYHWDLPMCLMEKGGLRNPEFPDWYEHFAEACFRAFGDRVPMWSTFNEPSVAITLGYIKGKFPPFEMSLEGGMQASLNMVLAHHRAVGLYRKLQAEGICRADGKIDTVYCKMDFVGINYYYPERCAYDPENILKSTNVENFYCSPDSAFDPYPIGLFDSLLHVSRRYGNPEMYVTENGLGIINTFDAEKECDDEERVGYLREHLRAVIRAAQVGMNVNGYFWWNDADSYEQLTGYDHRFGLTWVDHETGETRWKKSRFFLQKVCKTRMVN